MTELSGFSVRPIPPPGSTLPPIPTKSDAPASSVVTGGGRDGRTGAARRVDSALWLDLAICLVMAAFVVGCLLLLLQVRKPAGQATCLDPPAVQSA